MPRSEHSRWAERAFKAVTSGPVISPEAAAGAALAGAVAQACEGGDAPEVVQVLRALADVAALDQEAFTRGMAVLRAAPIHEGGKVAVDPLPREAAVAYGVLAASGRVEPRAYRAAASLRPSASAEAQLRRDGGDHGLELPAFLRWWRETSTATAPARRKKHAVPASLKLQRPRATARPQWFESHHMLDSSNNDDNHKLRRTYFDGYGMSMTRLAALSGRLGALPSIKSDGEALSQSRFSGRSVSAASFASNVSAMERFDKLTWGSERHRPDGTMREKGKLVLWNNQWRDLQLNEFVSPSRRTYFADSQASRSFGQALQDVLRSASEQPLAQTAPL